jgi:DNA-binding Lrp family transcriptional regulator
MALTMIKVQSGHEESAYDDLRARTGIRDVYRLFGEYNFFLVLYAEGMADLNRILQEVKEEEKVIDSGPLLLTTENDLANMTCFQVARKALG